MDLWYGPQELWPDHCVRGTKGASLPDEVRTAVPWTQRLLVARNGFRQNVDSYRREAPLPAYRMPVRKLRVA